MEACAARGVHSIVEKPFTATLADADRATAASHKYGTKLSVIFQRRWYPGSIRIREAIDQGRLGRPILGEAIIEFWRGRDYYDLAPWRGRWDTEGGGVIINQAPHMIDLLQWYMGPVEEVFCYWDNLVHPYVEVEDVAVAVVRFVVGGLGLIPAVHGEEGRKTVEFIEAMYRSGQTGAPVRFPVPVETSVVRGAGHVVTGV